MDEEAIPHFFPIDAFADCLANEAGFDFVAQSGMPGAGYEFFRTIAPFI